MIKFTNGKLQLVIKPAILQFLKIFQYGQKIRLGVNQDGGYVIADNLGEYDCYMSAGVSNEESFSRDFISKFNMNASNSFAFDGTINDYPWSYTNDITFIKKNIEATTTNITSNLSDLFSRYTNIFLKMDIEGGEFPWINSLTREQLSKCKQIVIEFHDIFGDGFGSTNIMKCAVLQKLMDTHYAVHIHGNNCGRHVVINGRVYPSVIEITYIRKDLLTFPSPNRSKMPIPNLDFPNNPMYPDYDLIQFSQS